MVDLWPDDLGKGDVTPPISILKGQAEALTKKTGGQLTARVITSKGKGTGDQFCHFFMVEVPMLDYSYELFAVLHDVLLYPVEIAMGSAKRLRAENEGVFTEKLRELFGSQEVLKIIRALISQASAA